MRTEALYALAAALEAGNLGAEGPGEQPLSAGEIFLVLEALQELGVDLSPIMAGS